MSDAQSFVTVRRGYDPAEVDAHLVAMMREQQHLRERLATAEARLELVDARADQIVRTEIDVQTALRQLAQREEMVLNDAYEQARLIRAAADEDRAAVVDDHRRRIEAESTEMDEARRALRAESDALAALQDHLDGRISRAASELVRIVDGQGGLGAYSQATSNLVEFARLLLRTPDAQAGAPETSTNAVA